MLVLMVHNRYLQRGGEDASFEDEVALLREHGHEVILYEESNKRVSAMSRVSAFLRTVWSRESYHKVSVLLRRYVPDVMHVHNFFPLMSPSIYYAAARCGVPVVQTLHNYRLLCPNAQFLRRGAVCEDCMGRYFAWPGVLHACYRGSRATSLAVATMMATHRALGTWRRRVACYIALTEFSRRKFIEGGLPEKRITVRANYIPDPGGPLDLPRAGALFVGMLHPWKGADVLLKAWRPCEMAGTLTVAGDGPERARLEKLACERVRFVGMLKAPQVAEELRRTCFLVFPSIWYETFGRTIVEAFACGTPVIASRIGTAADLVRDGVTGLHFEPGNADDLAEKIAWAAVHPDEMRRMGQKAREVFERDCAKERCYESLMEIYRVAASHSI
jgi:glycosyltransferase involved in cell wall biosynthesis